MANSAPIADAGSDTGPGTAARGTERRAERQPERRCIVTRAVRPVDELLRFVVGPEGDLVADLDGRLPGRGIWVGRRRELVRQAVKNRLFARAARSAPTVADDLPGRVETAMRRRCLALLGLARRAGQLILGYEKARAALAADGRAIAVTAHDGSAKGREKLLSGLRGGHDDAGGDDDNGGDGGPGRRLVIDLFGVEELSLALGRENVVHAALRAGGLADRFLSECRRLEEFRG